MTEETPKHETNAADAEMPQPKAPEPIPHRALDLTARVWRPAGTAVAVALALFLAWHVVNGKHGLSSWQQMRQEDKGLQKEIQDLQQENARLKVRVDRLKSDPDAIEHEARERLRYAKPGEVIVDLSGETKPAAK
ncbi:MAG TPA: septum formation initiator family protein [Terracidiphilus sp.]|nr:septum formation initiator family protein [Terracidiphilus sp.]